jgi:histidine triad (HIT) family protein
VASDCLFCRIAARELPATIVREEEDVVAFRDVSPQAPTHLLVIPREHIGRLSEAKPDHGTLLGRLLLVAVELAREEGLGDGFRVVVNDGRNGGQTVGHLHVHVLGGRAMKWPPG